MTNTLKVAPDLYNAAPINCDSGARFIHREIELVVGDLISTQLLALAVLPAGHKLISAALESDDLDTNTSPALTISVGILNTYYNKPAATAVVPAAYGPGSKDTYVATATDVDPQLVSGQNIFTTETTGQAGGRKTPTLAFTDAIGVDYTRDRVIAIQFPTVPGTAAAGTIGLILGIDAAP